MSTTQIEDLATRITSSYIGVDGVARKIKKIYIGVKGGTQGGGNNEVVLPSLENPATADEVFLNKEAIDAEGNVCS